MKVRPTVFALAGALALAGPAGAGDARPPSIVFILADDLGWGDPSCYGQERFRTPSIDRLAAGGTRFTRCYAGSTVCAPSRCCLMTGLHTGHALVRGNANGGAGIPLRPEDLTVAELLRKAGYATGLFGKWGLGVEGTAGSPDRKGFAESFGYLDQMHAHRYNTDHLFRDGRRVAVDPSAYSHDLIAEEALAFVRRNRDRPFFLYWTPTIPHAELRVPEDSLAEYRGKFPEKPFRNPAADADPSRPGYRSQPTPRAAYAAMIGRLDRDVGRLLDLLADLGLDRTTAVFFSSDNGPHKEGGGDPWFFRSAGPLRGIKRDLYEGGIRVPMVVRWPGRVPAGAASDVPWAFWDFLPTAADMAGTAVPAGLDGMSVLPVLEGRLAVRGRAFYWEFHEGGFSQAAVMGDWKAVRRRPWLSIELYDLRDDGGETRDIAGRHPDVVAAAEAYLATARTASPYWRPLRRARL